MSFYDDNTHRCDGNLAALADHERAQDDAEERLERFYQSVKDQLEDFKEVAISIMSEAMGEGLEDYARQLLEDELGEV